MRTIVLISCASKKVPHRAKAKDLYISPLFNLGLQYARSLNPDDIFILSAKYGLLGLEQEIDPYDLTLNGMLDRDVKAWANSVINQLGNVVDLQNDRLIILAGERYRKHLLPHILNYTLPMRGLGIGKQLQFLKARVTS
jgi:cytoplasmic iron level regulating protein YaaA (DUF328/UPF0246 family)